VKEKKKKKKRRLQRKGVRLSESIQNKLLGTLIVRGVYKPAVQRGLSMQVCYSQGNTGYDHKKWVVNLNKEE
jgi:hypothetical protein